MGIQHKLHFLENKHNKIIYLPWQRKLELTYQELMGSKI